MLEKYTNIKDDSDLEWDDCSEGPSPKKPHKMIDPESDVSSSDIEMDSGEWESDDSDFYDDDPEDLNDLAYNCLELEPDFLGFPQSVKQVRLFAE